MGIENLLEDGAGAFAADKLLETVDPNAGIIAKGIAALAGGEGASMLSGMLGGGSAPAAAPAEQPAADDSASDDQNA